MRERTEVQDDELGRAFSLVGEALKRRLSEKGRFSFIGSHEILGDLEEEKYELTKAIHEKKEKEVASELVDVAVGAIFGVASLMANARAASKPKA
jgi:hypothetical protein